MILILVGGPTGIGKTRFIDALLSSDSRFSRPRSFTTRLPRENESGNEYYHVSSYEFEQLRDRGAFVTVDEVYGNYYAIGYESLLELDRAGRIAIKEVHPKNHSKIKALLPQAVSVVLLPLDSLTFWRSAKQQTEYLSPDRVTRFEEDQEYYALVDATSYDIVLFVRDQSASQALVPEFLAKLEFIISAALASPLAVDEANKTGYNLIASEFTDELRLTTANFHDLSYDFFRSNIEACAKPDSSALDLGTGRGYLLPLLGTRFHKVVALDLSIEMLKHIDLPTGNVFQACGSAFQLPFADHLFDVIVSSLADPYLRGEALHEVGRVLKKQGVLILSSPTRDWSDAVRSEKPANTRFISSSGADNEVYSFTYTNNGLLHLIIQSGFQIEYFCVVRGEELRRYSRVISPALTQAAQHLGIEFDRLPILQLLVAKRLI